MEIRNWNEIIGRNGIRTEIDLFQNGNNTAAHDLERKIFAIAVSSVQIEMKATSVYSFMLMSIVVQGLCKLSNHQIAGWRI